MSKFYEYEAQPTFSEKMMGSVDISPEQSAMIKKSYMFLGLSVISACGGAYLGAQTSLAYTLFYSSWMGWVLAMIVLNVAPMIAMACRHNPVLGTAALIGDGALCGLIMGPMIAFAGSLSNSTGYDIVTTACLLTLSIFAVVTIFVMFTGTKFRTSSGLVMGLIFAIIAAVGINMYYQAGMVDTLISVAIGVFGVIILINATSTLLHDKGIDSPIAGALMLFAGIFNIFVAVLHILMSYSGGGDD